MCTQDYIEYRCHCTRDGEKHPCLPKQCKPPGRCQGVAYRWIWLQELCGACKREFLSSKDTLHWPFVEHRFLGKPLPVAEENGVRTTQGEENEKTLRAENGSGSYSDGGYADFELFEQESANLLENVYATGIDPTSSMMNSSTLGFGEGLGLGLVLNAVKESAAEESRSKISPDNFDNFSRVNNASRPLPPAPLPRSRSSSYRTPRRTFSMSEDDSTPVSKFYEPPKYAGGTSGYGPKAESEEGSQVEKYCEAPRYLRSARRISGNNEPEEEATQVEQSYETPRYLRSARRIRKKPAPEEEVSQFEKYYEEPNYLKGLRSAKSNQNSESESDDMDGASTPKSRGRRASSREGSSSNPQWNSTMGREAVDRTQNEPAYTFSPNNPFGPLSYTTSPSSRPPLDTNNLDDPFRYLSMSARKYLKPSSDDFSDTTSHLATNK